MTGTGPWESASEIFVRGSAAWGGDLDVGELRINRPEVTIVNGVGQRAREIISDPDAEYFDQAYSAPGVPAPYVPGPLDKYSDMMIGPARVATWKIWMSHYQIMPNCDLAAQLFVQIHDGNNWSEYWAGNIFGASNKPLDMPPKPFVGLLPAPLADVVVRNVFRATTPQVRFALSYGCRRPGLPNRFLPPNPDGGWTIWNF
jgi:hypothetical protein